MKHLFIFLFGLTFTLTSNAQLLRSEVYDFSIGDYFGLEHKSSNNGSPLYSVRYQMFHILSKQLSITADSVSYVAERQTYIPALPNGSGGATTPSYDIDTVSFLYKELNSPFSPLISNHTFGNSLNVFYENPTDECYNPFDSLMPSPLCINNSGQAVNFGMDPYFNDSDTCAFEPFVSSYFAYSHAGGPYGGVYNPGDPTTPQYFIDLNFVNHNGVACGNFPGFFVAVDEVNALELTVYPNPASTNLVVEGISSIATLNMRSSDGKDVSNKVNWNQLTIDVQQLSPGVYFLFVTDPSGKNGMIRFTK